MGKTVAGSRSAALAPEQDSPTPEEIQRQLQNILASPAFHGSKRCNQFLQYVCEKSLSGEAGTLKERTIAIEVFGRNPQSDLGEDTIVRVGAREVRKRLAQYYVTPEGAASEILIDLLPGSYVPEFRHVSALKVKNPEPAVLIAAERGLPRWRPSAISAGGFVLLAALVGLAIAKWAGANPNSEAFNRFWEPAFRAPEPLLIAVAHPIVYHPSRRASALSAGNAPQTGMPVQRPIQLPPNTALDGSDLVPVLNQYVGFGDMVAATEVSAMLARKSKAVRVRLASSVEFADLRKAQTLLIGAITNRWTMELQPGWRFQFSQASGLRTVITDTAPDSRREWSIPAKDDGSAQEDYILVCRIRNSVTGGLQLVTAGLKQFGTEAGGRLLADPDQLGVILRKIPAGWETKNLQIVLHARVIGNTPAQPEVVAWHVW
jgi:hypothetical protein